MTIEGYTHLKTEKNSIGVNSKKVGVCQDCGERSIMKAFFSLFHFLLTYLLQATKISIPRSREVERLVCSLFGEWLVRVVVIEVGTDRPDPESRPRPEKVEIELELGFCLLLVYS